MCVCVRFLLFGGLLFFSERVAVLNHERITKEHTISPRRLSLLWYKELHADDGRANNEDLVKETPSKSERFSFHAFQTGWECYRVHEQKSLLAVVCVTADWWIRWRRYVRLIIFLSSSACYLYIDWFDFGVYVLKAKEIKPLERVHLDRDQLIGTHKHTQTDIYTTIYSFLKKI